MSSCWTPAPREMKGRGVVLRSASPPPWRIHPSRYGTFAALVCLLSRMYETLYGVHDDMVLSSLTRRQSASHPVTGTDHPVQHPNITPESLRETIRLPGPDSSSTSRIHRSVTRNCTNCASWPVPKV
ncbi:hypothetical protein LIA77_11468 [Sarocladium implicatum]|nr:hypothetical protein LIA77_11468 [Sarocladium implicatum]